MLLGTDKKKKRKTCAAIIPAAGTSSRMLAHGNKLFAEINEIPVLIRTLQTFEHSEYIDEIIIPTQEALISTITEMCNDYHISKVSAVIQGGATRANSVLNGVKYAVEKNFDLLAVHDAARPFISPEIIAKTVRAAAIYNAAAPAVAVKDTVKKATGKIVVETVPRDSLFAIQTPQIFDSNLLFAALQKVVNENLSITDDCSAVEAIGMRVYLTDGDYFNIKITTPEDLIFGEAIATHLNNKERNI